MTVAPQHPDRFVNPYTFVSLPASVPRAPAVRHDKETAPSGEPLLCGAIDVEWTLRTPMLLPQAAQDEGWIREDGSIRVPGSSMKGVIRSMHETLFNGCLRIVNDDFVPAYRASVADGNDLHEPGWSLGVVTKSKLGEPQEVALCDATVYVEVERLRDEYQRTNLGLPTTGDLIELHGTPTPQQLPGQVNPRLELRNFIVQSLSRLTTSSRADGCQVFDPPAGLNAILVTDLAARPNQIRGQRATYFWAVGPVTDTRAPVSREAVTAFNYAVAGSRDRQTLHQQHGATWQTGPVLANDPVRRTARQGGDNTPLGRRRMATGLLHAGDVLWVRFDEVAEEVVELRLSQVWRRLGTVPLKDRLPREAGHSSSLLPCGSHASSGEIQLCPSCSIFGAVDPASGRGKGRQTAYRGRVRIGALTSVQSATRDPVLMAPMGAPRLGAGMFALEPHNQLASGKTGDLPSQWGSNTDMPPRLMRGRKYYWHSDPQAQVSAWDALPGPRYRFRQGQHAAGQMQSRVLIRSHGADGQPLRFHQRIHVTGLTADEARSVLCAVDPSLLLGQVPGLSAREYGTHVGGGKPLGLGSLTARILGVSLQPITARYSRVETSAFRHEITREDLASWHRAGRLSRHLVQLARVLDRNGLEGWQAHVAYPPGTTWDQAGNVAFVRSFSFFGEFSGEQLAGRRKPYEPLAALPNDPNGHFDPTQRITRDR